MIGKGRKRKKKGISCTPADLIVPIASRVQADAPAPFTNKTMALCVDWFTIGKGNASTACRMLLTAREVDLFERAAKKLADSAVDGSAGRIASAASGPGRRSRSRTRRHIHVVRVRRYVLAGRQGSARIGQVVQSAAAATGSHRRVGHGGWGEIKKHDPNWARAVVRLARDPTLRHYMAAGFRVRHAHFSPLVRVTHPTTRTGRRERSPINQQRTNGEKMSSATGGTRQQRGGGTEDAAAPCHPSVRNPIKWVARLPSDKFVASPIMT